MNILANIPHYTLHAEHYVILIVLPCSLRSMFSTEGDAHNPLHGSGTEEEAEKEIKYFFPPEKTLAVIKPNAIDSKGMGSLESC